MITAPEAGQAIYGTWRLARGDASGLDYFDNTVDAFWRSFYAALIVLPAYVLIMLISPDQRAFTSGPVRIVLIEGTAYVIGWVLFPLVMFYLTQMMDRRECYLRFIAAYNWSSVLQYTLFLCVTAIAAAGILPEGLALLLNIGATVAVLIYSWYIAKVALLLTGPQAAGIVLLDLVLGMMINLVSYTRL